MNHHSECSVVENLTPEVILDNDEHALMIDTAKIAFKAGSDISGELVALENAARSRMT